LREIPLALIEVIRQVIFRFLAIQFEIKRLAFSYLLAKKMLQLNLKIAK
jgi:hypothetical protein